jgi:hypothetical protein
MQQAIRNVARVYQGEVERLATVYRDRILKGEFSGHEADGRGPKYQRLQNELAETHPWLAGEVDWDGATSPVGRLVSAVSPWVVGGRQEKALRRLSGWNDCPGEAMAHDVLAVAAQRGWVKPMTYLNARSCYAVVRRGRAAGRTGRVGAAG